MWTEQYLDELLTTPSQALANDLAKVEGDIMILVRAAKWAQALACWLKMLAIRPA